VAVTASKSLAEVIRAREAEILEEWLNHLTESGSSGSRITADQLRTQCRSFLADLARAMESGATDIDGGAWQPIRDNLREISYSRALQGFSSSETASFVFSLKQALFAAVDRARRGNAEQIAREVWALTEILDQLGLFTIEAFQKGREEVILRQQQEIAELSTPVVRLWKGIVAVPLIGTLDSARTQVVMENLLQTIVDTEAEIAIIDITGVPTVDTLVAQYLLKTVSAARLMGADCIISGIRSQIAQTMVHLGVELNVVSKANLADAFALALQRTGRSVVRTAKLAAPAPAPAAAV
jgi:rsbT co-antagonist protein RsbR